MQCLGCSRFVKGSHTDRVRPADDIDADTDGQPDAVDDELDDPTWVQRFAGRWKLSVQPGTHAVAPLYSLRAAVREALAELTAHQKLSTATVAQLNSFSDTRQIRHVLSRASDGTLSRVEHAASPSSAAGSIVREFQDLVVGEGAQRLKLCANPLCRWAFYDESRNRSRRWCDSAECGNVMKVRAFRERKKARETAGGSQRGVGKKARPVR